MKKVIIYGVVVVVMAFFVGVSFIYAQTISPTASPSPTVNLSPSPSVTQSPVIPREAPATGLGGNF